MMLMLPFLLLLLTPTVCAPMANNNNNNNNTDDQEVTESIPPIKVENETYYVTVISEDQNEEVKFRPSGNPARKPIFAVKTHYLRPIRVLAGGVVIVESHIPLPSLKASVVADGKLEIRSKIIINKPVELTVEDSGEVRIADLHCPLLKATVSGNGKLFLSGRCERQEIRAADNALVDHTHLSGKSCNVQQKNQARVAVNISDTADANIENDSLVVNVGAEKILFEDNRLNIIYTKNKQLPLSAIG